MLHKLWILGLVLGLVTLPPGCKMSTKPEVVRLESVTVAPRDQEVLPGGSVQFTATATWSDGLSADHSSYLMSVSSSDPSVATISSNGVAIALAPGTTTITATAGSRTGDDLVDQTFWVSRSASTTLTVIDITSLEIAPSQANLDVGDQLQLRARGIRPNPPQYDITSAVRWSSGNTSVATVSPSGEVTAVGPGETTIRAVLNDVFEASATVTVGRAITTLAIDPESTTTPVGGAAFFTAIATFNDGTTEDYSKFVTWSVDDMNVAQHDSLGTFTARSPGSTTVRAVLDDGREAVATLTVTNPVTALDIEPGSQTAAVGGIVLFAARATFADGSTANYTQEVTWSVDDPAVATPNTQGSFIAVAPGSTTVKAVLEGGLEATATLTVTNPVTALVIEPSSITAAPGGIAVYSAKATFVDGSVVDYTNDVSWSVDDPSVATYNTAGSFVALAPGSTTVRARTGTGLEATANLNVTAPPPPPPPPGGNVTFVYSVANDGVHLFTADLDAGTFEPAGVMNISGNRGLFMAYDPDAVRIWVNRSRTERNQGFDLDLSTGWGVRAAEFGSVGGGEGRRWAIDPFRALAFSSWLVPTGTGAYRVSSSPPYFARVPHPLDGQGFQVQDIRILPGPTESTLLALAGGRLHAYTYGHALQFVELTGSPYTPLGGRRDLVVDQLSGCVWLAGVGGVDAFKLESGGISPQAGFPRTDLPLESGVVIGANKVAFAEAESLIHVYDSNAADCSLTEAAGSPVVTQLGAFRDLVPGPEGTLFAVGSKPGGTPDVDPDIVQAFRLTADKLEWFGPTRPTGIFATDALAIPKP